MTFGDLFSGIGGFRLGLERAGMVCSWACEIDPFCRKVYAKHWPETMIYGDIRELKDPPYVDLLCGGFPCQDLSLAGKRAGITGARSGLWSEFARLIGEVRPRFALVENVPGLLVSGMERVLGDLAEIGYDAEWHCIPAAALGAPHIRDRVWIIAYSTGDGLHPPELRIVPSDSRQTSPRTKIPTEAGGYSLLAHAYWTTITTATPRRQERQQGIGEEIGSEHCTGGTDVADAAIAGLEGPESTGIIPGWRQGLFAECGAEWWAVEPDVGRVAHGVPNRVDRLKSLGNAVVPQVVEWIGRRIMETVTNGAA